MVSRFRALALVLILAGAALGTLPGERAAAATPEIALRKIQFALKGDARERFFAAMRAFSTKYEFKIDIKPAAKGKYSIHAAHGDVRIVGSNAPDRSLFTLNFYAANNRPVSQVYLDVLLIDLKKIPKKTPGVTIRPSPDGSIN